MLNLLTREGICNNISSASNMCDPNMYVKICSTKCNITTNCLVYPFAIYRIPTGCHNAAGTIPLRQEFSHQYISKSVDLMACKKYAVCHHSYTQYQVVVRTWGHCYLIGLLWFSLRLIQGWLPQQDRQMCG